MITQLFNVVYHSILIYLSIIVLICPYCYWDAHGCAVIVVMQKNICWWSLYVEIMSLMIWSQVGFHRSGFLGELPESYWNNPAGWWCQPLWKIWKSMGRIIPNIWKLIKLMFQTTNQYWNNPGKSWTLWIVHWWGNTSFWEFQYAIICTIPQDDLISGWWYTYPSEKWWTSSVGIMTFPIWWEIWKNKTCSNHQPASILFE